MTRLLVGLAVALAAYWLLLFVIQRAIAFPAPSLARAPERPADAQVVSLQSEAGRTVAWLLPPLVPVGGPAPVLIMAHGNAELINHWAGAFTEPREWGLAVLLVEYPGYGESEGSPSRHSIQGTFEAAVDWVATQAPLDPGRIIAYGRSLGGGAATDLTLTRPIAALVLESTFTKATAIAATMAVPPFLVRDPFDNVAAVRRFRGPILVLHGEHDGIIPPRHGRALAEAAGVPLHTMPCGHNDCPRPWKDLHAFLGANDLLP